MNSNNKSIRRSKKDESINKPKKETATLNTWNNNKYNIKTMETLPLYIKIEPSFMGKMPYNNHPTQELVNNNSY